MKYCKLKQQEKLPIGIQTFSELIEDQHYYVDRAMLDEVAERYAIVLLQQDLANRFAELIQRLHQTYQQKVLV